VGTHANFTFDKSVIYCHSTFSFRNQTVKC